MTKFQELSLRCSGKFVPKSPLDFVGTGVSPHGSGSKTVAQHLTRIAAQSQAGGNAAIKILLNGPPGIGKTALALYLQALIGCDKWSTTKLNGTQLKIEVIEDIARTLHYRTMFGEYRMLHFDEVDEMSRVAQVRFLSVLDDLNDGVAVVCTSNCKLAAFEPRFQSRFQVFEISSPTDKEIESLLCDYIDPLNARQIATFAGGNVRQALLDAKGVLQQAEPEAEPALAMA